MCGLGSDDNRRRTPCADRCSVELLAAIVRWMRSTLFILIALVPGCSFDAGGIGAKTACDSAADCVTGTCVAGQCVRQGASEAPDADAGAGAGALDSGAACMENACGGCQALAAEPGVPCGECAAWVCDGDDRVVCDNRAPNACGGCADLDAQPGTTCGTCAAWVCDPGRESVFCGTADNNACGGCAPLAGEPGSTCGRCGNGRWACDGADAVSCEGAVEDVCGACAGPFGVVPGDPCGCAGSYPGDAAGWTCTTGVADCDDGNSAAFGGGVVAETSDDTAGPFTQRGALQYAGDEDWYVVRVRDAGGLPDTSSALPVVTMTGAQAGDYVCVFWFYDDARDYTIDCGAGTYGTEASTGAVGCCSLDGGTSLEAEIADGSLFSSGLDSGGDASGDLWVTVGSRAMASTCHDYSLRIVL